MEKGNLRELALARMGHLGLKCRDVRTRECGIQDIHHKVGGWVGGRAGGRRAGGRQAGGRPTNVMHAGMPGGLTG